MPKQLGMRLVDIDVHNDHDHAWIGPASGPGEIYINYGMNSEVVGDQKQTPEYSIADEGGAKYLGDNEAVVIVADEFATVTFDVYDADWWPDDHDQLNGGAFVQTFQASENFGIGFQVAETGDYTLHYELFELYA